MIFKTKKEAFPVWKMRGQWRAEFFPILNGRALVGGGAIGACLKTPANKPCLWLLLS